MSKWIELKASPEDGHYLCFCNDIVSSWQEVLCCWGGKWRDMCGKDFDPIITHYAKLPAPPEK